MSRRLASGRAVLLSALVTLLVSLRLVASGESGSGPKPSGKYAVGRTLLYCIDPQRNDPVAEDPAAKREFMVIVWYPAEPAVGVSPGPWMPAPWASSEIDLLYYRRRQSDTPITRDQAEHAIHDPVSYSAPDVAMANSSGKWPVLLFAPGAGVNAAFYSTFTEDLASHGYVIFGIEPTGWVSTQFPDGHTAPFSDKRSDDPAWFLGTAFPLWAADLRFTLDQMVEWNKDPRSLFFHRLDLTRIGAFGHSFGGGSSILTALDDTRIKAVLNLDGSPFTILAGKSFLKPLMVIKHNVSPRYQHLPPDEQGKAIQAQVEEELSSLYLKGSPGFRVEILNARHMTFSDMSFLNAWADSGRRYGTHDAADDLATVTVIRHYIRAFFDKFLMGKDSLLLHPVHPDSAISTLQSTEKSK
jgi:dienelactone hydrolase